MTALVPNFNSKYYWEILGIDSKSDVSTIKKAYYRLSKQYHPDKNQDPGAADIFSKINHAYTIGTMAPHERPVSSLGPLGPKPTHRKTSPTRRASPTRRKASPPRHASPADYSVPLGPKPTHRKGNASHQQQQQQQQQQQPQFDTFYGNQRGWSVPGGVQGTPSSGSSGYKGRPLYDEPPVYQGRPVDYVNPNIPTYQASRSNFNPNVASYQPNAPGMDNRRSWTVPPRPGNNAGRTYKRKLHRHRNMRKKTRSNK